MRNRSQILSMKDAWPSEDINVVQLCHSNNLFESICRKRKWKETPTYIFKLCHYVYAIWGNEFLLKEEHSISMNSLRDRANITLKHQQTVSQPVFLIR